MKFRKDITDIPLTRVFGDKFPKSAFPNLVFRQSAVVSSLKFYINLKSKFTL